MIRARTTAALAVLLVAWAAPAGAADAGPSLEQRLVAFVRDRAEGRDVRIDVPPVPMTATERGLDARFSLHPRQRLDGRVPVRVALLDEGRPVRTLVVPVDVMETRRVLVARRAIRSGDPIPADAIAVEARSGARLPRDVLADPSEVAGMRARRHIAAGSALRRSRLEASTDVRRGDPVRLVLVSGNLRIESTGRAKEDGNTGDFIAVQNLESRRVVTARVGGDGLLHVEP